MSDNKNVDNPSERDESKTLESSTAVPSTEVSSIAGSVKTTKTHSRVSSSSERQIKFERAQKCLENAALVSKRIKEHRKATAELLGRPFDEDEGGDTASELASTMSERTGYSAATDVSATLSVQDALNIPGISESLANTLKQKELLMERIKQYKEISKRPMKSTAISRRESIADSNLESKKGKESNDVIQLLNTVKEKENALSVIQVKMKAMETTILDLQEKINEKDQLIEAKNKATTLMSDSLSKKEKDSLLLLEDTRQQMIKMQENFVTMESEWKMEKERLEKQIQDKNEKISNLEQANTILENSRFEISVAHSDLLQKVELKNKEIHELQEKIESLSASNLQELTQKEKDDHEEEKGSLEIANMVELTKKVELLEQLNCQIRQTNKELENKLANINPETKSPATSSPSKKASPLPTRKGGRNTASKIKSPWTNISTESLSPDTDKKANKTESSKLELVVQSLNKDILEKEYIISKKDELIAELESENTKNEAVIVELKNNIRKNTELCNVAINTDITTDATLVGQERVDQLEHIPTPSDNIDLEEKLKTAQEQLTALNEEIDAANKNMIKVKSNHKLKLKQMQKTIENFSKVSDSNAEIVRLNEELHQLSQKVAELEEEKGNLQLHLVDYDSGRLTESDMYKKMVEMGTLAETRLKSISVLESQKFDLVQELHELQQKYDEIEDKLADISQMQSDQVSSEIKSVQLEEQIDQLSASKKEMELIIENLKMDKGQLEENTRALEAEKQEILHKLEQYIQENMELTDKLEKLSAEKVSSAESIEIVESLTTQEKLELEEYNRGITDKSIEEGNEKLPTSQERDDSIETLREQIVELNNKIDLFTQEREEVMDKMNKINSKNESLLKQIAEMNEYSNSLQSNIEILKNEKEDLLAATNDLNHQIEELKRERLDIMKESIEITKPSGIEEVEGHSTDPQEDKTSIDKTINRNKSVKQLTKEILKLKNIIKEREDEIGDCQMKILAMEEQQQKQSDLMQNVSSYENKIRLLTIETQQLKEELDSAKSNNEYDHQISKFQQTNELLQQEIQNLHHQYANTINARDGRIHELQSVLLEYEKQIVNYGNTLQEKDKELSEYINQITKLNDVSQKLKSTIELLEEEKAKDPNAELVKSLNKQITNYQKKLTDCEDKLKVLEEEKARLHSLKETLENKNAKLESDLKKMQEAFNDKQNLIKELQVQQSKDSEELSNVVLQVKERDEEIHEIKLELRRESIENEKLRTTLLEKENEVEKLMHELQVTKENLEKATIESETLVKNHSAVETKNKEFIEKFKKLAISLKKKTALYNEIETHLIETQKQLETKNEELEQLKIQVNALPALQEKLKYAEEELNRLQSQKMSIENQKSNDITQLQIHIKSVEEMLAKATDEATKRNESYSTLLKDQELTNNENNQLKLQIQTMNNKLAEYEVEQKNNSNLITKLSSLEADISQKQVYIEELIGKIESQEQLLNQLQFGLDAKVQERDLYIESLEAEISKYKDRICRLQESVSIMEDRRNTLERKADQLDTQLLEKQKAYAEYTCQEDNLVNRLANLMDHDRVIEKQLFEIENENKELQNKVQHFSDENQRFRKSISDIQEYCNTLVDKASRTDFSDSEAAKYQTIAQDLDAQLKRITQEHQNMVQQNKRDIEDLESEFNNQIENSIKEKKALSEKYEKLCDNTAQLEQKLLEYRNNIETLNINVDELTRMNQQLIEKLNQEKIESPDYTEQYISEINKLNSIVNSKSKEISDLTNKIHNLQSNNLSVISNFDSKVVHLNAELQNSSDNMNKLLQELNIIKHDNEQLQKLLTEKEEEIIKLSQRKKVTFEMNIPKTEGMIISSTIESLNEGQKYVNISAIESEIVSEPLQTLVDTEHTKKVSEKQTAAVEMGPEGVVEEVIVPKKAYLCYKGEANVSQAAEDPFNSDEGWGLAEGEDTGNVIPGTSHLKDQIFQLQKDNDALKADLQSSNNKLIKVLKKLKELKTNNEIISNELRISKQLSETTFLDSAIEDEMKINIQELEKKIEDLTTDLKKEKREKDSLRKQNEVFNNANDRLTEMKEKLDNEIELWKYKFKEANDKLSTLQWSSDVKDSPDHNVSRVSATNVEDSALKAEIMKLENENDELQAIVDQLNSQNKELLEKQNHLNIEINDLNIKLEQSRQKPIVDETLNSKLENLATENKELLTLKQTYIDKINELEIQLKELLQHHEQLKFEKEQICNEMELKNKDLINQCLALEEDVNSLKQIEIESKNLAEELEETRSKVLWHEQQKNAKESSPFDAMALTERFSAMEDYCNQMKVSLNEANSKIQLLETENQELILNSNAHKEQMQELNVKLQNLNSENDQLLSTVTELRSSVSAAVDQRGYEIAEIWKQHLTQREADFQQTEQELRSQLNAADTKYEQLLDSVQSSTQEETSKLVTMEQISSLQNKLHDKEEHLRDLQDKYSDVLGQLDMLRSELEDEKLILENKLLTQQEDYEKHIKELSLKSQQHSEGYEQVYQSLQIELTTAKTLNDELSTEKRDFLSKLDEAERQIVQLNNQLKLKESEIYQKTHDLSITLSHRNEEFENIRKQLLECEKKIEDLTYEKEAELAVMRLKMHENEEHYEKLHKESELEKNALEKALNEKIIECTNLSKQILELNRILEDHVNKTTELQNVLENQEIEIVTLKDELSNLSEVLKSSSSKIEKHVTFSSDTKPGVDIPPTESPMRSPSEELLDAVPRAELDLALYMLHQRDVRCEELTMELTQLLEERDTLQLRLSDSLRSCEELKSSCKAAGLDVSFSPSQEISELPSFSIEKEQQFVDVHRGQSSRSSSISDPDGERPKLQAKLSELRTVRHSRDVRLRQDSEQRQLGLRLMQRDVANLPPEAVEQLAQAHHTLSRDSQSTSTVLLNWLRGKSTPKVVHM